jgi:hypothetical protein
MDQAEDWAASGMLISWRAAELHESWMRFAHTVHTDDLYCSHHKLSIDLPRGSYATIVIKRLAASTLLHKSARGH